MRLTDEEKDMLDGAMGRGVQKAMQIVTALGKIYGAHDLVPVKSVQVSGVSYKNLGEAGLEFLAEWAAEGGRVRVPTTLNPAGLDLQAWKELGFDGEFAEKQARVIQAFTTMGISPTCTCTPYLVGNLPERRDHLAWAESSAVSFANSVLGARTNREGGPSALAAAITGRTARFGLHLDENRLARLVVDVRCPVESAADFGALGTIVGRIAGNRVPYLHGLHLPALDLGDWLSTPHPEREEKMLGAMDPASPVSTSIDRLKLLGAAMAASGAVALYHVENVTPESHRLDVVASGAEEVVVNSLDEGYAALDSGTGSQIDLVWIGCPHASLAELQQVVDLLRGRPVRSALWVTMARVLKQEAARIGLVKKLEALGGRVVADTCLVVAPVESLGFKSMATPSGKGAYYTPGHSGLSVRYGSLEQCIEAAVTGRWEGGKLLKEAFAIARG